MSLKRQYEIENGILQEYFDVNLVSNDGLLQKYLNDNNDLKHRFVDAHPFVPADDEMRRERCKEIFAIQSCGLAKRIMHVGSSGAVVGISELCSISRIC